MSKAKVANPGADLDGGAMTRISRDFIKQMLILPYLDLDLVHCGPGIGSRDETESQITTDATHAITQYGFGVKCSAPTP